MALVRRAGYDESVDGNARQTLARAVTLNVGGRVGGFAVAFVSAVLLARLLGPHDRGLLAVVVAVTSGCVTLSACGLQVAIQYFASRRDTGQQALLGNSLLWGGA